MKLSLEEIIQDLRALEARIRAYERRVWGYLARFLVLYQDGLLDDEGFEQSTEFIRWASAYALKLEREALAGGPYADYWNQFIGAFADGERERVGAGHVGAARSMVKPVVLNRQNL